MNQQQPQVDERVWSEAELKVFQKKHKVYLEAVADVNSFIEFLRDQHGVDVSDGWQLGERGFVRQRPEPQVTEQALPKVAVLEATKARKRAVVEPVTAGANGADIPIEEL